MSAFTVASLVALSAKPPHPPPHHPPGFFVTLNDGRQMPAISLGTCCGSKPEAGLMPWIQAGGVGIDTAIGYNDQVSIGQILKQNNVPRESVYITSKTPAGCAPTPAGCAADPDVTLASINASLQQLGVEYIDLMLLHRPCEQLMKKCSIAPKLANCTGPDVIKDPTAANRALWQGMAAAQKMGLVKSIGVSNYFGDQLAALGPPVPAVNQCEMSVQGYDNYTIAYCEKHGIRYESYGAMRGCPFSDPTVSAIAAAHNVSTAQVCLRWVLQRGAVIASGTGSDPVKAASYAKENLAIFGFNLTAVEMGQLDDMQL